MRSRFASQAPARAPICPQCRIPFQWGSVPCPDKEYRKNGCGVAHYGWLTCKCGMMAKYHPSQEANDPNGGFHETEETRGR